jgi:hypothetical protein
MEWIIITLEAEGASLAAPAVVSLLRYKYESDWKAHEVQQLSDQVGRGGRSSTQTIPSSILTRGESRRGGAGE